MAKTPKPKPKPSTSAATNPRSRASRRLAASPPSNAAATPHPRLTSDPTSGFTPSILTPLHTVHSGGIAKKQSSSRAQRQSRQQRLRRERGVKKAVDLVAKLERKVEVGRRRGRVGRERRRGWEDVNVTVNGGGEKRGVKGVGEMEVEDSGWGDEEEEEVEEEKEEVVVVKEVEDEAHEQSEALCALPGEGKLDIKPQHGAAEEGMGPSQRTGTGGGTGDEIQVHGPENDEDNQIT